MRREPSGSAALLLVSVTVLWGANYTINKWGLRELDVVTFNAIRFAAAGPLLLLAAVVFERAVGVERRHWGRLLASTVVGIIAYQLAFSTAVRLTSPTESAILIALSPFAAAGFAALSREDSPGRRTLAHSLVALVGVVLVILGGSGEVRQVHLLGDAAALAAAVLWGWYPVITRPLLEHYSPLRVTAWTASLGGVALAGCAVVAGGGGSISWPSAGITWFSLGYSVLLVTVYGLVAWYHGVRRIGSARSMLFMFAVPVAAAAFAVVVGEQQLTWPQAVGAGIVVLALVLAHSRSRSDRASRLPAESQRR
nr:DMT family transporter [Kibdelosporangium sp. MJ126-NF4]CEL23159.1 Permease of the drug/metabolite transporter (DMT) superfamily [Kibdelosporangium sp. MJ126-NF4]CTQ90297.1 Permease of the drug/metabolite transporter (DMT) superfamily [Kibdelosporangium sp. MJ126-NF4]